MKKILATLLVATMLMSCMTFVSFAAGPELYVAPEVFGDKYFEASGGYFMNMALYDYVNFVNTAENLTMPPLQNNYLNGGTDPLYGMSKNGVGDVFSKLDASLNTYIPVVIYTESAWTGCNLDIDYDETYVKYSGLSVANGASKAAKDNGSVVSVAVAHNAGVAGYIAIAYFHLVDDIASKTGENAAGEKTVDFNLAITVDPETGIKPPVNGAEVGTLGADNTKLVIKGLQPKQEEEEDPVDITGDDFATSAGVVSSVVPAGASCVTASGLSAADKAMFVAGNADSDIANAAADAVYSAVFATVDLTGKNAPEAYGFVIIPEDGTGARFYEAKAETVVGGKFGMVFFGDAATLGLYKAAPAVKVDGKWLYNADNASAL